MTTLPDRLHLGCGHTVPDGWLNVDGSPNARLAKHPLLHKLLAAVRLAPPPDRAAGFGSRVFVYDIAKPLPWPEGTFSAVYASHTLEHMHLEEGGRLLRECFRVLKPGGVVRMVVPDLRPILQEYFGQFSYGENDVYTVVSEEIKRSRPRADIVNLRLLLRDEAPPRGSAVYRAYRAMKDLHSHKWMYDGDSLAWHIRKAGFTDVAERGLHESRIPGIQDVERPERVLHGVGVCVEGVKPGR